MPSLRKNLISMGQLTDSGMKISFTCDSWKITRDVLIVAHSKKDNTLYVVSDNIGTITTTSKGGKQHLAPLAWTHEREGMQV